MATSIEKCLYVSLFISISGIKNLTVFSWSSILSPRFVKPQALLFKNNFYEIDSRVENQLILGKDPDYAISTGTVDFGSSHSIILNTHISRVVKLNLIPLRGGKYPSSNKITDGTANLYDLG